MLLNKGNWSAITTSLFVLLGFQLILQILQADLVVLACGPGRAGGRRFANRLRKYPPLVQRQYIPNVSENTFGASGAPEGPIKRHDKRFKELIQNWNPDIEFRDDERTGADRMMSQRLKEKLSVLAISVMNQWPNVRLRVIEGWDEDRRHSANSLHYEGRAVDITTSDKDRSKYGMLARLAVEAGFDWVHYESRSHVHCSVKSEKADSIRNNGCFDAESVVETPMGQMEMSQLQTNDLVLTMNSQTGELQFSPVLMWLDRDELNSELYVNLTTKSGKQIRLTSSHLIYLADEPMPSAAPTAPAGPMADPVNGDLSSEANNRVLEPSYGGNNYYYDLVLTQSKQTNSNESVALLDQGASQIRIAPASFQTNSPGVQVEPSSPNQREEVGELNDYVYTTYARNAVVGQYLLIHQPDDEVKFDSSVAKSHDGSAPAERRSSPNRLMFTSEQDNEFNSRKAHKDAEFKTKKNKKYKHNQPQSVTGTKVVFDEIVTSDKDRSKYGMLARLAVEAGFDWVHYESRSHVHCSVKSEKADSIRNNGCFDAESVVETPMGQMEMSQLQTNDLVLTMNSQTGELQFSPVLMWLDRDELNSELYVNLTTKSGKQIRLTSSHLIYLADEPMPSAAPTAPAGPMADPVNGDLSSEANNRVLEPSYGGNNYYYDLVLTQSKQTNSNESVALLDQGASQIRIAPASFQTNSPGVQVEPSSPNQREEVGELNDYVYTTYARNAVVGQYLLIHQPDDEVKFDSSVAKSHDGSAPAERRSSPNRLMFTSEQDNEFNSRKAHKDAEFKTKKNKKYKHNQPQSVTGTKVVFDEIVSVKYVSKHGIYAPLTRDGNIVVNSVVASCYAVISDHDMAHWSMAPVRWLNSLNEKLFGIRPETPTYERTVDFIRRRKLYEQRQQIDDASDQHDNMKNIPDYNTTNSLNRTTATRGSRHVHWYPIVLYNIARYVLPNNYLY